MENKHTTGPWTYRDAALEAKNTYDRFIVECNTNIPGVKGVVAKCGYRFNAEFIVTACNSHDELVEACELGLSAIQVMKECSVYTGEWKAFEDKANQALAKAKGGERDDSIKEMARTPTNPNRRRAPN